MRRAICFLFFWLTMAGLLAQYLPHRRSAFQPVAAGGAASFSDDFNRATLGANWTKISQSFGTMEISGSTVAKSENTFDTANRGAFYSATPLSVSQYVKLTLTSANSAATYPGVLLRVVDASSPAYVVEFRQDADTVQWGYISTITGSFNSIQANLAYPFTYPFTVGVTITGTGSSTVVRIWDNPTADAPTSATSWDGTSADIEFTNDPATAADTGTQVGLAGYGNGDLYWDNIFAGDIP